jgi:malonyl-CoA O-methyltransferase
VFANMLLPWTGNPDPVFGEVARVLRPGGLFCFSSLGPDSFGALRDAWRQVDDRPHVHEFPDMHLLGDAMVRAGLADPVLDVDRMAVTYRDPGNLFTDLAAAGARNALAARHAALTGKVRFGQFKAALDEAQAGGTLSIDMELVYGHAWGQGPRRPAGEFRLAPGEIGRRGGRQP